MSKMIIPGMGLFPALPSYNADLVVRSGVVKWRQHERSKASFSSSSSVDITWPDFQSRMFEVKISEPIISDGNGFITLQAISVTSTGCTIQASAAFTGEVDVDITEVIS